jgi:hypothetical protein
MNRFFGSSSSKTPKPSLQDAITSVSTILSSGGLVRELIDSSRLLPYSLRHLSVNLLLYSNDMDAKNLSNTSSTKTWTDNTPHARQMLELRR